MTTERVMSGDLIRHHVTNSPISKDSVFYPIANFFHSYSIPFNKHVLMLWIAALVTLIISLWATRRYRKNSGARPKGISHIYEMLFEFIKQDIVLPNIGDKHAKRWTPLIASFFILLIKFYRFVLSPVLPRTCRFHPTCSQYALDALKEKSLPSAVLLIMKRLSRCHPLHSGGYDPVNQ